MAVYNAPALQLPNGSARRLHATHRGSRSTGVGAMIAFRCVPLVIPRNT